MRAHYMVLGKHYDLHEMRGEDGWHWFFYWSYSNIMWRR
jgi:hypothetical protein